MESFKKVGIPKECIENLPSSTSILCQICENVLDDPVICLSCEYNYCSACIDDFTAKNEGKCQHCNDIFSKGKLRESSPIWYMLNDLIVKCPGKDCGQKIKYWEYLNHKDFCAKGIKKHNSEIKPIIGDGYTLQDICPKCDGVKKYGHDCVISLKEQIKDLKRDFEYFKSIVQKAVPSTQYIVEKITYDKIMLNIDCWKFTETGWVTIYDQPYSHHTTTAELLALKEGKNENRKICVAAKKEKDEQFIVAAIGTIEDVLNKTTDKNRSKIVGQIYFFKFYIISI